MKGVALCIKLEDSAAGREDTPVDSEGECLMLGKGVAGGGRGEQRSLCRRNAFLLRGGNQGCGQRENGGRRNACVRQGTCSLGQDQVRGPFGYCGTMPCCRSKSNSKSAA